MKKKLNRNFQKIIFILFTIVSIFIILNKDLSNDFDSYNKIWLNSNYYSLEGSQIANFFTLIKSFNSSIKFLDFYNLFLVFSIVNFLFLLFNLINLKKVDINFFSENINFFIFLFFIFFIFFEFYFIRLRTGLAINFVILAIHFILLKNNFFKYFSSFLLIFMGLFISYEVFFFIIYTVAYIFIFKKIPKLTLIFNIVCLIFLLLQFNLVIFASEPEIKIINYNRLILLGIIPFLIYLHQRFIYKFNYPNFLNIILYKYFSFILVVFIMNYLGLINQIGEKISRFISLYQFVFFFYLLKINNIKKNLILLYLLIINNFLFIRAIFFE